MHHGNFGMLDPVWELRRVSLLYRVVAAAPVQTFHHGLPPETGRARATRHPCVHRCMALFHDEFQGLQDFVWAAAS